MTIEMREKLSDRVLKLKRNKGVSYAHIGRQLGCSSQAVLQFANGRLDMLGDEKANRLWDLTVPFFPEPKAKQVANEQ